MLKQLKNVGCPDTYLRPFSCCHDDGRKPTGWKLQELLNDFEVKDTPTTSRNPTSNDICERMHHTVGNVLRTLIHTEPPGTLADAKILIDSALATASHAARTNASQATGYSSETLAFYRDMLLLLLSVWCQRIK